MLLEEAGNEQKRFPAHTTDEQTAGTHAENNGHGQFTKMCGLIKTIFEKISTLLFDQETVSKLLKLIFERVSNGRIEWTMLDSILTRCPYFSAESEQSAAYYEHINQLLKVSGQRFVHRDNSFLMNDSIPQVFIQHPFIFNSPESLELLCNLLNQRVLELGPYQHRSQTLTAYPLLIS